MMSPFAPLFPWLADALGGALHVMSVLEGRPMQMYGSIDMFAQNELLDLRHGPTRYAVLRALADAGHARPWALGAPWSPLTDEQAGRATAAILCAVGEDPSKPVGVVPICVAERWEVSDEANGPTEASECRRVLAGHWHKFYYEPFSWWKIGWKRGYLGGWMVRLGTNTCNHYGRETGDAGRLAADNAARPLGCLFIEELTP